MFRLMHSIPLILLISSSAVMAGDNASDARIIDMYDAALVHGVLAPVHEKLSEMEHRQQKMKEIPHPTDAQKQVIDEHGKLTKVLKDTCDDIHELRTERKQKLCEQKEYEAYLQDWMKRDQEAGDEDVDDQETGAKLLKNLKAETKQLEELLSVVQKKMGKNERD